MAVCNTLYYNTHKQQFLFSIPLCLIYKRPPNTKNILVDINFQLIIILNLLGESQMK